MAAAVLLAVVLKVIPAEDAGSVNWVEVLTAVFWLKCLVRETGRESKTFYKVQQT